MKTMPKDTHFVGLDFTPERNLLDSHIQPDGGLLSRKQLCFFCLCLFFLLVGMQSLNGPLDLRCGHTAIYELIFCHGQRENEVFVTAWLSHS